MKIRGVKFEAAIYNEDIGTLYWIFKNDP